MNEKTPVTCTIKFAPANMKWTSELSRHNERQNRPQEGLDKSDRNSNINWNLTKFNRTYNYSNLKSLLASHCENYVNLYNERQIETGHRKRCYDSAAEYVKKNGRAGNRLAILTIGDSAFKKNFERRAVDYLKRDVARREPDQKTAAVKAHQILATGWLQKKEDCLFDNICRQFNRDHNHIQICKNSVHTDEMFCHSHIQIACLPEGKRRPSFSLSTAICQDYPKAAVRKIKRHHIVKVKKNGKTVKVKKAFVEKQDSPKRALRALQADLGPKMVSALNHSFPHIGPFELTRTGNATHASQREHSAAVVAKSEAAEFHSQASFAYSQLRDATSAAASASVSFAKESASKSASINASLASQSAAFSASTSSATNTINIFNREFGYQSPSTSEGAKSTLFGALNTFTQKTVPKITRKINSFRHSVRNFAEAIGYGLSKFFSWSDSNKRLTKHDYLLVATNKMKLHGKSGIRLLLSKLLPAIKRYNGGPDTANRSVNKGMPIDNVDLGPIHYKIGQFKNLGGSKNEPDNGPDL